MIILFNPRSTKPRNRRLPLSVLALGAVLEGREDYEIVDGNLDDNPTQTILRLLQEREVEMLGVTVMPGPQMAAAVESCQEVRRRYPKIPIVWGGYFPSIYSDAALNARYVDYVVRGQKAKTRCSSSWKRCAARGSSRASRVCPTRTSSASIATILNG